MDFRKTVDRYFECVDARDRAGWLDLFSDEPGLAQTDPVGTPSRHSKEELGAFWDQITGLLPEPTLTPQEFFPGHPHIALTWEGRGRGNNGTAVVFRGIDIFTPDSQGKILKLDAYWDAAATLPLIT